MNHAIYKHTLIALGSLRVRVCVASALDYQTVGIKIQKDVFGGATWTAMAPSYCCLYIVSGFIHVLMQKSLLNI